MDSQTVKRLLERVAHTLRVPLISDQGTPYHTRACQRAATKRWKERVAWEEKWPNYCHTCEGYGAVAYSGSYWEPSGCDPCPMCAEVGRCPRCGEVALTEDGSACLQCRWAFDGKDCQLPPMYECEGCSAYALSQRALENDYTMR